jgi:tetratricopeptide (TPR) repeat protein
VAASCATRLPVVTTPAYPSYPFPTVPQELVGTSAAVEHERAWLFLQAGDLDEAALRFAATLQATPEFHPSDAGLGFVELARGQATEAVAWFDRALVRTPAYVPALLGRGEALLLVDRVDEAIESFQAALAADPGLTAMRQRVAELRFTSLMDQVARARAASQAGRDAEARAVYQGVIAASPESSFLYIELAEVERRQGDTVAALGHLERAVTLDPSVATAWVQMSDLYVDAGDLERAMQALLRADAIEPGEEIARRLESLEVRRRAASLPPEYGEIETAEAITRGQLAALIGWRFEALLADVPAGRTVIVTDARDHWAYDWVIPVAQAGIMEADTNYRFQPERVVTRAELAQIAVRLLRLPANGAPSPAAGSRASFSDLAPGHLSYAAASEAVGAGVLLPLEQNTFQPGRAVNGVEAIAALGRLRGLIGRGRAY